MRALSNTCLRVAQFTRGFGPVFRAFIALAFKARELELRIKPDPEVEARLAALAREERAAARREYLNASIRGAVRVGLTDTRNGTLAFTEEIPILPKEPNSGIQAPSGDPDDASDPFLAEVASQRSLSMLLRYGDGQEREAAEKEWIEKYPDEPVPLPAGTGFVPSTFERTTLNGSFKITPALRAKMRKIAKRKGFELLVVVNKTNTIVTLGLGQIGDKGGVNLPIGAEEPHILTDHYSYAAWLDSPDFRRAVAKGWIEVLIADSGKKETVTVKKLVTQAKKNARARARKEA